MGPWLEILRRHRVVRASAAAIFLYGFAGAATSPYQSLIAIRELGMSDRAYAALSLTSSLAYVAMAIAVGLISDRYRSYRRPLIFVTSFGIIGYGMVWAFPSVPSFALATLLPLALFHSTNSMLFGNVRAVSDRFDPEEARIANALMRMMISLSWVVMPGAVGLVLAGRQSMIGAYLIAALVAAAILLVVTFWLEPETRHLPMTEVLPEGEVAPEPVTRPAALQDLRLVLEPGLLLRVLGVALISQMLHINGAVLPLIVTGSAHGQPEDVGFLVGLVAVLEVIFMIFWARATRRLALTHALMICAILYLGYLAGIALASAPWQVYAASLLAGFAAAGMISLPISYLLDLIKDRPGLSASLIAVNMFAGGGLSAGVFALGTGLGGYGTAAVLSGLAGCVGAALLIVLERKAA
ncbi:MAG: MFS transporter [Cypionkella sp.]|jgi:MFS transporter, SET family, sugar efflux transporter